MRGLGRDRRSAAGLRRSEGLKQLAGYLSTVGVNAGWLLIFDQRPGGSWEERLTVEEVDTGGRRVRVRGM